MGSTSLCAVFSLPIQGVGTRRVSATLSLCAVLSLPIQGVKTRRVSATLRKIMVVLMG